METKLHVLMSVSSCLIVWTMTCSMFVKVRRTYHIGLMVGKISSAQTDCALWLTDMTSYPVFETGPASPRAFRRALRRPGRAGNLKASGFLIKSPQAIQAFFRTGVRRSYFELNGLHGSNYKWLRWKQWSYYYTAYIIHHTEMTELSSSMTMVRYKQEAVQAWQQFDGKELRHD